MLKILSAKQLREADGFTIKNKPIDSIDLMEIAASKFCEWYQQFESAIPVFIFCGPGNNGGDGLAIARLLSEKKTQVQVYILKSEKYSVDFSKNLKHLENVKSTPIKYISSQNDFPSFENTHHPIIIDALFGTGLNKPLVGVAASLVNFLNLQDALKIAVDIPSGFFADDFSNTVTFHAHHTLTFHSPKLSFLFADNFANVGVFSTADIGLADSFITATSATNFISEPHDINRMLKPRIPVAHKGTFGHALIYAGSPGKMGAALLCAAACVKTGAGLTTVLDSNDNPAALNAYIPEAMTEACKSNDDVYDLQLSKYNALALGPGIGTDKVSSKILWTLIENSTCPLVLDADALNILASEKKWEQLLPKNAVLTPHMKEFERIAGKTKNWQERHNRQVELSVKNSIYIVLKGHYTCITTPEGNSYFNITGNAGMAKGGSGDVLTGMIVSLLAQNYSQQDACIIGVHLHGLAADMAVEKESIYSITATGIVANIGNAYSQILSMP